MFAGVEARAVARNVFLDGNTFRSSHDVGHRPLVSDFQICAALVLGDARISATQVIRTAEFDDQDEADQFGAISVTIGF
ncbi:MAG: lipid A deacylase LpxR family protein [Alphaproteobacteria bacterium]|nr:lipid A deacylase LpxR family protein [Alphaproteobacteria bacterium]